MTKVTQISFEDDGGPGRRRIHLREISGDSDSPLETIGQDLRAARLRRGDDLATVSRALKIRKDHLEAVEEDNFAGLPGKTYAIGFVRSYAQYLGLDVVQTVERYKQEISGRRDETVLAESGFHIEEPRRLPYGWRIVAGVVGLALIYGVWHLVSAGYAPQPVPPAPSLNPPRPQITADAKPETPPPADTGNSSPSPAAPSGDAQQQSAAQAPAPSEAPVASAPPQLASPTPAPTQSASALPASPSAKAATASSATGQTAEPAPALDGSPGQAATTGNSRVVLKAHSATRITIRGEDGTIYANRDIAAGDSYSVPAVQGLSLAVADAGALDAVVDGLDLGRVGQNQEVLGKVSLDPHSLVDRFNSR